MRRKIISIICATLMLIHSVPTILFTSVSAAEFALTFVAEDNTLATLSVEQYSKISDEDIPTPPDKSGYDFIGWTYMKNDPAAIVDLSEYEVLYNITFYAYYKNSYNDYPDVNNEIYYSDFFFEYTGVLVLNPYIANHNSRTYQATIHVIETYMDTPAFTAAVIEHGIETATSATAFIKSVSDSVGLSNFRYNDELDDANQIFIQAITDVNL